MKSNYLYAQTYEAQGEYSKAIEKLNEIDRNIVDGSSIAGEESTFVRIIPNFIRLNQNYI